MQKIALLQFAATLDATENLATIERLTSEAAGDQSCDVVIAPEAAMHDFGAPDTKLGPVAQDLDGPFVSGLTRVARARGAVVVAGMFERSPDPARPYNTIVALSPDGSLLASYRKVHLYDSFGYRESDRVLAGEPQPATFDVDDIRLGLLTCYDIRFPEHSRALVDDGADVLVVPTAWVSGPLKGDHWMTLSRARAIENTVYLAAAAQCGRTYCGHSMLVDPLGVTTSALGEQEGTVVGTVDAHRIATARRTNPALTHRRFG